MELETWKIVVIVAAAVVAIVIVIVTIYCCKKRSTSTRSSKQGLRKTNDSTRLSTVVLETGKEDWDPQVGQCKFLKNCLLIFFENQQLEKLNHLYVL